MSRCGSIGQFWVTGIRAVVGVVTCLALVPPADAQEALPPTFGVKRWTTADGLPSQFVPTLSQTADDFLWFEAGGALVRFDGISFVEADASGDGARLGYLSGSGRGAADTMWVVDRSGQVAFYQEGHFQVVDSLDLGLHSVAQGGDGRLWVMSAAQVWVRGASGFEPVRPNEAADSSVLHGRMLWADSRGRAWTISGPGIVARRVDDVSGTGDVRLALGSLLANPSEGRLLRTRLVGAEMQILGEDGDLEFTIPTGDYVPLLMDRSQRLWVAVPGGLEIYSTTGGRPRRVELGDPSLRVLQVVEDRSGSFWAGTNEHGLFRVQRQPIRVFLAGGSEGAVQIASVSEGRSGSVLAVDLAGAVTRLGGHAPETLLPAGSGASVAYEDSRGTLWIGVESLAGIRLVGHLRDGSTIVVPIDSRAVEIVEDPREPGVLWYETKGLYRVAPYEGEAPEAIYNPGWNVRGVAFGAHGDLWVAGLPGVTHLTSTGVEEFFASAGYPLGQSRDIYVDEVGDVWVGTYRAGLVRIRDGEVRSVRKADGLQDDVVSSVLPDGRGNLWMASNRGIHRASLDELNAFLDGRIDRVVGAGYSKNAGFVNPETSGRAAYRDAGGRLWFPTFNGVAMVDPALSDELESGPPSVVLEELRVDGEPVSLSTPVQLAPSQRRFDIRYTGIFLRDPESLRYQVWMKGLEEGWRDVGTLREVHYASLGPGEYVFQVRAINGAGVVSTNEAAVALRVPPHFRETLWFPLLTLVGLAGLVVLSWRARVRLLKDREAALTRIVDERTSELAEEQARTKEQAERIEALDQARSGFFANLSHELRTPLTLILGPLRDLVSARSEALDDHAHRQIEAVLQSGRRLNKLVDQLMEVARLESGMIQLRLRTVDAGMFLHRIATAFVPLAESRAFDFSVDIPAEPVPVELDTEQADAIFANLIGNAFKFTHEGGRITLRLRVVENETEQQCVIEVQDDGPGISPEHLELIFDRFHQVEGQLRSSVGTGLGLALTRDLVELHGGTIAVESEVGGGARFTVHLPLAAASDTLMPLDGVPPAPVLDDARASASIPGENVATSSPETPEEDMTTVLLVEDNLELRVWMRSHMVGEYRVLEAGDGVDALETARSCTPDVIIADVMMPRMNGDELCRNVKSDPDLSFIPVILVTARGSHESLIGGLLGGADDYIVKPFDMEELLLRVRNLVATRRRLRERYESQSLSLPRIPTPQATKTADDESLEFVRALYDAVMEHMSDEDFDAERLARALCVSRATLYRRAEALADGSPMDFVWRLRLDQAALWLVETEASVAEIAYGVGFKSVPHFSRRFKERFEVTPTEHRRAESTPGV
jgi:signal transduction histidine kinase/DNA-binding response OmpR family regulator/ligand-binding sensor domain-containing protein